MRIETIKNLVKFADERSLAYIITADNEHHYYGNYGTVNRLEIIWDDANEIFFQITTNQEPGIKSRGIAVEASICGYEHIQHCRILLDTVNAVAFYNEYIKDIATSTDEQKQNVLKYISYISSNTNYPKPVTGKGSL